MDNMIQVVAIYALPVVFAITLHEAAHGYAARHFGDPTAWQLGRISLNPLRHIDPIGTVLVPILILWGSSQLVGQTLLFGWAKPVPVDFGRLRHPKRDMLWVAAAGPAANLAMLLGWALLYKYGVSNPGGLYESVAQTMGFAGILINASLMLLNLLPLPPLDGGRIMVSLLPHQLAWRFAQIERFGLIILLILLFTGLLNAILLPLMGVLLALIQSLFNF